MIPEMATRRSLSDVEAQIRQLLAQRLEDEALRSRLDALAEAETAFFALSHFWGPALYARNPAVFRPFLLSRLTRFWRTGSGWEPVRWKTHAKELGAWMEQARERQDAEVFRRLYAWSLEDVWRKADQRWRGDLLAAWDAAASRGERSRVLAMYEQHLALDEESALRLCRTDPALAAPFVLRHLPLRWAFAAEKRVLFARVFEHLRRHGEEDAAFTLWRRQVPLATWKEEALRLCASEPHGARLRAELEKRHPQGWIYSGVGPVLADVLEARGTDVLPYVMEHLGDVNRGLVFSDGHRALVRVAERHDWAELKAGLVRMDGRSFDGAVAELVRDQKRPVSDIRCRLALLAGVGRSWNFGPFGIAEVTPLSDTTATALYARFPDLVRGPFRPHVGLLHGGAGRGLLLRALEEDDEDLVDYLASRVATYPVFEGDTKHRGLVERLADVYGALRSDPPRFARRGAAVLGHIPAYAVWSYDQLVATNRLARILLERATGAYAADPAAVRDLMEAPQIHVQILALRILARPEAAALAADTLDLLLPTLLRPLHRRTRRVAFDALACAASASEAAARRVLQRAREAHALPDEGYPKEALLTLMAGILHRWPELRGPRERVLVAGPHAERSA